MAPRKFYDLRFPMPYSLEDYQKGQTLCMGRSFVDLKETEKMPAKIIKRTDTFTEKHYDITKLIPGISWLKPFIDMNKMILIEKVVTKDIASYSEFTVPAVSNFSMKVYAMYAPNDSGNIDNYIANNIFKYIPDLPKIPNDYENCCPPKVVDFLEYDLQGSLYDQSKDPNKVPNPHTKEMLQKEWIKSPQEDKSNFMCSYKLVDVSFKIPLVEEKMKKLIIQKGVTDSVIKSHRDVFFSEDTWRKMTTEEIQKYRDECIEKAMKNPNP